MHKLSLQPLTFNFAFLIAGIYVLFLAFLSFTIANAQNLPKEIRGYKVYKADISVKNEADKTDKKDKSDVLITADEPKLVDISLTGITLETSAEIDSLQQSGTVDFLAFQDFRVNGLAVEVEEYKESFEIKKRKRVVLPKPIKIFVGVGQTLRGALNEWREAKDEWTVTGRVFVFGRFKKSFLKFKRVIPVEVSLKIKNPLGTVSSEQSTVISSYSNVLTENRIITIGN
ncbi:MAG: hypothetical protein LC768_02540 [Acidobacteria bacterium]|nr:hypothetical protein [Acidobacteriota bacterium]MCA1637210.1 hypothetical protein [Acidobacteriota bacterium]